MSWTKHVIEVYLFAIIVLIHLSLLFCKGHECIFDATPALQMVPLNVTKYIQKILKIVPISLETLQIIAHFLLIGDALLIISLGLKLFGGIISSLIKIVLLSFLISFIVYLFTTGNGIDTLSSLKDNFMDMFNKMKIGKDL